MRLLKITTTQFRGVLQRLGIIPYPAEGFTFGSEVVPVSLVDSDIILAATTTPPALDTPSTAGVQAAPAAGTVLADTGAQVANTYNARILIASGNNATIHTIDLQRRDSGNAANIWVQRYYFYALGTPEIDINMRVVLNSNERLRVITVSAADAGRDADANIWLST